MVRSRLAKAALFCAALGSLPLAAAADDPGGHPYDPCTMVTQQDAASAFGVATDQVFQPKAPTKNECYWAVAAHTGAPGQQAAFSLQTIDQVKQAPGLWGKATAVLSAARQVPGVPITNSTVNSIFDNAQTVANLGDKASWKNRTLSVLKAQLLMQVQVSNVPSDDQSLKVATSMAHSALSHLPTSNSPPPQ